MIHFTRSFNKNLLNIAKNFLFFLFSSFFCRLIICLQKVLDCKSNRIESNCSIYYSAAQSAFVRCSVNLSLWNLDLETFWIPSLDIDSVDCFSLAHSIKLSNSGALTFFCLKLNNIALQRYSKISKILQICPTFVRGYTAN